MCSYAALSNILLRTVNNILTMLLLAMKAQDMAQVCILASTNVNGFQELTSTADL